MSINIIRVGDATDHGGKVETGSSSMKFDGRYVARKGDRVSCPQHLDVSPNIIEEGDESMKDNGIPIARHGHRASCGCHLISSLV
ncbi:PAAR domain-containing protein [Burkholderia sp. IMCC1007]|uniref:PAAR domain-containing protein n=1 Tax=Burkholderia sp. IMCC1007 TaxID=3004104 RepID=UPI0022B3A52F|nr:PAAR domain-containing protein [Burkholderia sp. IMCC1007]